MSDSTNKREKTEQELVTEMELGFAGNLAKAFIHSPLSPLIFAAMMLLGIYGLIATPRQEDPEISVPMIDIFYRMPGASAEEISKLLIGPQERVLSEIPGVKHVYSVSDKEMGIITMEYHVGEDMESAIVRTNDKLQANADLLPPGAEPALMKPKEIDDVPVLTLTLWSNELDDSTLRTLAVSVQQHMKQVPKTGNSFVTGGRATQVRIDVKPERLSGYGLSMGQMAMAIQGFNSEQTVGSTESSGKYSFVETGTFLRSVEDVKKLVVGNNQGKPVYMTDVATVTEGPEEAKHIVSFSSGAAYDGPNIDNAQAVTIAIAKQKGANGVAVVNEVMAEIEKIKGYIIPDNVNIEVSRDYGKTANDKVNALLFKLVFATAVVVALVWWFMGFKPAMVVFLTIPVVLVITVFSAMFMGYSINRVSLFALIFSIGFLVDNAIVIVENIYRRWLMHGSPDTEISVDAVREVGNPTVLATYTVVAALLPMGFVSGMMGPYMEPIPALGSVAMVFSLFAALVFAPWLAMRIVPSMDQLKKLEAEEHKFAEKLESLYNKSIGGLFNNRKKGKLFLYGIIAAFALSCLMFYTTNVTVKMLPFDNKAEFQVAIDMPAGTALPDTASFTNDVAEVIRNIEEVVSIQSYVGTSIPFDFNGLVRHYYLRMFPWQAQIQVTLTDKGDRSRSSHEIAVAVREALEPLIESSGIKKFDGAGVTVVEMPPGPPVLQTIVAEVHGPDAATRRQVARDIKNIFNQSEFVGEEQTLLREPMSAWRFEVDTEKAALNGVSIDTINKHLAMAMGEFKVGDLKQKGVHEPTYILLQVPLSKRSNLDSLHDLPVMNMMQQSVPLGSLGKFVEYKREDMIFHKDLRPVEFVVADAKGRLAAPVYAQLDVDKLLADYTAPDGVSISGKYTGPPDSDTSSGFEWSGEWTVTYETFRDMGMAYGIALIAIYMLVVWQFGNFIIPAVIMAPIPLTLLGIVPGHMLFGADFTATSMIGWIALAGIIVRNSILLVDFTLVLMRDEGKELYDAVITAAMARTRPIIITALALVGGSAVILTDPIFQGMAISLLFGVFMSTALTLLVVPLGCLSIGEKTFRVAAGLPAEKPEEESNAEKDAVKA